MKPKILFHVPAKNTSSALFNVFDHVCNNLKLSSGRVLTLHRYEKAMLEFNDYDMVVHPSPGDMGTWHGLVGNGYFKHVCLFHGFESKHCKTSNLDIIKTLSPALTITTALPYNDAVMETGNKSVVIPFSFNTSRFSTLPYPKEFTIGYMGIDSKMKQFEWVDQIGSELGIPVIGARRTNHVGGEYEGKELEFYKQISCYVMSSWDESGPLPPIEALLCGRPIVATNVGMMPYVFERGAGGVLTTINYDKLKSGVEHVRNNFKACSTLASKFKLPDTSGEYEKAILGVLEE